MSKYLVPFAAAVVYLLGLALHEFTHVGACWATGCSVEHLQVYPPEVGYIAATSRKDAFVRASTILLTVPLLVVFMLWLSEDVWSWRLLGLAAVAGYLPRSESDWSGLVQLFN